MSETVLVTGASGYIALHCIRQLLQHGYRVRGTLRSLEHEARLRHLFAAQMTDEAQLTFAACDLLRDDGWEAAAEGCTYVLHVASPIPHEPPKHESAIVEPARQGTRRVLAAALAAGVRRVVLTSSTSALVAGHADKEKRLFDESDWSRIHPKIDAYSKSKTLAERAAWAFVSEHDTLELAVINPGMVIGPLLEGRISTSVETVRALLRREYPGVARLGWDFVDVRDVVAAHRLAMTVPEAAGKRFVCTHEFAWMKDIADILNRHFPERPRIPTWPIPDFAVRLVALFDAKARLTLENPDRGVHFSNARIRQVLGWTPRPFAESVIDTAHSLIDHGLV